MRHIMGNKKNYYNTNLEITPETNITDAARAWESN